MMPHRMSDHPSYRARVALVVGVAAVGIIAALILPPLPQSQAYHQFADGRTLLGIPNCLDVLSNAAFLVVGLLGLGFLLRRPQAEEAGGFVAGCEKVPYAMFFLGLLLTGFGSGYYHWAPDDATLVWDRLPMTLVFTSMLSATIVERVSLRVGLWLLAPMVIAGAASVFYWQRSGNLWPYAAAQYLSIALIGLLLLLFPSRYTRSVDLFWMIGTYGLALVAQALDGAVFGLTHMVSGHTIKHLLAALAVFWVLPMLARRTEKPPPEEKSEIRNPKSEAHPNGEIRKQCVRGESRLG
jgi:hypothetical protein